MANAHHDLYRLPPTFKNAIAYFKKEPLPIYLVGGIIRNTLLGQQTTDLDLAVVGDGVLLGSRAAKHLGGTHVLLDSIRGISRVIIKSADPIQIDITSANKGIEVDLGDRDFTINSMAVNINRVSNELSFERESIMDPYNGYQDLLSGLIKSVSKTSLSDDPIRMMRAVRFSANTKFTVTEATQQKIRAESRLIKDVSPERVRDELLKILDTRHSYESLILLNELGITEQIIPELNQAKGIIQPNPHFWDVHDHMMETVGNLEKIIPTKAKATNNNSYDLVPTFEGIEDYFEQEISNGFTRLSALKLSCLLHDIGKPATRTKDKDGQIRFLGHSESGVEIAKHILERLKIRKKVIALVCLQIKHHLRPSQLAAEGKVPSSKAVYRYHRDLGDAALDTLYLSMADYLSTGGPRIELKQWTEYCEVVKTIINEKLEGKSPNPNIKLLSGHDIIDGLRLKPGPLIGVLLEKVEEAHFEGKVKNKEDAIRFLESNLKSGE